MTTTTTTTVAASAGVVVLRRLRRIRTAVRAILILGVAASILANILHADPNPISQTIAAWAPLALLLSVELITYIPVHRRHRAAIRLISTMTIAGIAAWVSYWHMVAVATRYGETGATPYLLPISVDGLIIVASISLVEVTARIRHHETTTETNHNDATTPATPDTSQAVLAGGMPAELLPQAQLLARAHQQATGTPITPADLAGRMRIPEPTATYLLNHLSTVSNPSTTPAPPHAHTLNGAPATTRIVQEADR